MGLRPLELGPLGLLMDWPVQRGAASVQARERTWLLLHGLHTAERVVHEGQGRVLAADVHPLQVPGADGHRVPGAAEQARDLPALVPPRHGAALLLAGLHPRRRTRPVVLLHELLGPRFHVPLLRRHGRPHRPQARGPVVDLHHHGADHADGRRRLRHHVGGLVVGPGRGLPPAPVHVLLGRRHVPQLLQPLRGSLRGQVLRPLQAVRQRPLHGRAVLRLCRHVPPAGVAPGQRRPPGQQQWQGQGLLRPIAGQICWN
mmetsp:Transcript_42198/g.122051  ORF Transcript_42198/g.122051 Transcript_42198/m.122051 type:complete len:258 (-) Transcript_42198:21-794(-)